METERITLEPRKMETITDIANERRERLVRAANYDALIGRQAQLKANIASMERERLDLEPLRRIHDLTGDVPPGVLTRSTSTLGWSVPSGMPVRDILMQVAGAALSSAADRQAKRDAQLTQATTALANVEAELSALERS